MKKVVLLLNIVLLLSAAAQESKNGSAGKTNAPIQISATKAKEHIGAQAVVKGKIAEVNVGERICRGYFKRRQIGEWIFQKETASFWESGEQDDRFGILIGLGFEDGVVAGGVLAQNNF